MKERKKIKRLLAGLLVIAIFIGQITYYSDVVLAEEYTSENVVIQARKISKTGSYVRINGKRRKGQWINKSYKYNKAFEWWNGSLW